MLKSFDENSVSPASRLGDEAENDAIACRIGNVLSIGFRFFRERCFDHDTLMFNVKQIFVSVCYTTTMCLCIKYAQIISLFGLNIQQVEKNNHSFSASKPASERE